MCRLTFACFGRPLCVEPFRKFVAGLAVTICQQIQLAAKGGLENATGDDLRYHNAGQVRVATYQGRHQRRVANSQAINTLDTALAVCDRKTVLQSSHFACSADVDTITRVDSHPLAKTHRVLAGEIRHYIERFGIL